MIFLEISPKCLESRAAQLRTDIIYQRYQQQHEKVGKNVENMKSVEGQIKKNERLTLVKNIKKQE